jgi:hypothetical protein
VGFGCSVPDPFDALAWCECAFQAHVMQPSLLDTLDTPVPDPINLAEGERRRDEGMAQVALNATDEWKLAFETTLARILRQGRTRVTSSDVVDVIGLPPGNPNLIGAMMRACAVKMNLRIIGTVKSARVNRHAGRITVWEVMGGQT